MGQIRDAWLQLIQIWPFIMQYCQPAGQDSDAAHVAANNQMRVLQQGEPNRQVSNVL